MAARFWVGGTGTWDASDTTHWAATSGGASGASVPGASDDVTFDASSGGGTVTVGAAYNPSVTSITMGAFTGTLDFSANNNSPTMQTFSCSGTGTRTLNMGSGTWTLTGNATTIWTTATTTNLTLNAGTSTVNCTYSGSTGTRTLTTGASAALGLWNVNISAGTDTIALTSTFFCNNLSFAGFSGTLNSNGRTISGNLTAGTGMTWNSGGAILTLTGSGSQTITSNGVTIQQSVTINGTGSYTLQDNLTIDSTHNLTLTQGTFDANNKNLSIGLFSSSNSNTRVLTMGSGTWTLTGNNTTIWTTSNVTGLTFTANTATIDCTYSGSTGTRTLVSGNAGQFASTLKVSAGSDTISLSTTFFCADADFTGFTGSLSNTTITLSGGLTLGAGMTVADGSGLITFSATSSKTITSNGVSFGSRPVTFNGVGGVWILQDDFRGATNGRTMTLTNGTFNANNKNVSYFAFSSSNSNTRTLTMGSGTWTLTGTGTVWNTGTTTNLTFNAGTSTLKANDSSSSSKTLSLGALTYYDLYLTGGGTGVFQIGTTTASKTFHSITVDPPLTVQVFAGSTIVLSTPRLFISGNGGQINTFQSTTNGQTWTISSATGTLNENYISLQDSIATGGGSFYAGLQSINAGNNTGWTFSSAPSANENDERDENRVTAILAVSSQDGTTVIPVYVDPNSHALLVSPF